MRLADRVQLVDPDWPSISRRFGAGIQAEIRSSETEKRRCALALGSAIGFLDPHPPSATVRRAERDS
jgi:hypothetical protein